MAASQQRPLLGSNNINNSKNNDEGEEDMEAVDDDVNDNGSSTILASNSAALSTSLSRFSMSDESGPLSTLTNNNPNVQEKGLPP